eukprot:m51a1_g9823 hypothetical protein (156) ;mRNA; f:1908216-1908961
MIIETVLSMDLKDHFSLTDQFLNRMKLGFEPENNLEDAILLAADMSCFVRPVDQAGLWTSLIAQEFHQQAEEAARIDLKSPKLFAMSHRNSRALFCTMYDFIALKMWKSMTEYLDLPELLQHGTRNRSFWADDRLAMPPPSYDTTDLIDTVSSRV